MLKRILGAALVLVLMVSFFTLFTNNAHAVSNMGVSAKCVQMIKDTEGFYAIPYWDYSQWTVGFGTRCPDDQLEYYKQVGIPVEEANALLHEQLKTFETSVRNFAKKYGLNLTQNQFDALVSFTYNLGGGVLSKESNTIVSAILSGKTGNDLIYAFSVYCMAGGEFLPGLMRRRLAEANMFINGGYSEYAPSSYCYVRYDANGGVRDSSAQGYDANMPAVPLSKPTKDGYMFIGWYTEPVGGVKITSLDETTHGMTLYAHWQKGETEAEDPVDPTSGINVIVVSAAVHVRCGPGIGYGIVSSVHAGDRLTIIGTSESNGTIWGQFSDGWISLDHTNYFEIVAPDMGDEPVAPSWKLPVYATVLDANGIVVYNGPHTTYPQLKTLSLDTQILLLETMVFAGKEWARYDGGWVQISTKLLIHDENKLAHNFTMVTKEQLTVRSGPGTSYAKETSLAKGSSHTVYSVVMVDGTAWGRVAKGWVNLDYTNYNPALLGQYQSHTYADWYTLTAATCVAPGQERRDCTYCKHYETRETALGDHGYGSWFVVQAATCLAEGLEQQDCLYCDHSQTRVLPIADHAMGDWQILVEATCTEDGKQKRTCQHCGHEETAVITATGHNFGVWYEVVAPTTDAPGQERRDCKYCDYYETRKTSVVEHNFGVWYVVVKPTCTEVGQERQDCQDCDYYLTREIEALGHNFGDWYVTKEATMEDHGEERRDCTACEHYETRQTDKLQPVTKLYGTLRDHDYLNIRKGPGVGYALVGRIYRGDRVEILEITDVGDVQWARIEQGWVRLTDYLVVEEVQEPVGHTHSFGDWYVTKDATIIEHGEERRDCTGCGYYETRQTDKLQTVTKLYGTLRDHDYLYIRSGPGVSYTLIGSLYRGDRVEILEITNVGSIQWARIEQGWVRLTGYLVVEEVQEPVVHTHSFGDWYVTKEATTTEYGQERRDCTACDHYEVRQTEKLQTVTKLYGTLRDHDYLYIRSGPGVSYTLIGRLYRGDRVEILEITNVGTIQWARIEQGWVRLTGYLVVEEVQEPVVHTHSFGDWYVTKAATTTEYGQERRDCTGCDHYEVRQTEKLQQVTKVYATITCSALSIREGAGTGYARLGYYYQGEVVEILEQVQDGDMTWGRTAKGWICLTGYTTLQTVTE